MEASIQSFSKVHDRLGRLLEDHQLALIHGDLERARRLLARFASDIHAHIRHEEDVLLPVYETRVKTTRIGDPETLRDGASADQSGSAGVRDAHDGARPGGWDVGGKHSPSSVRTIPLQAAPEASQRSGRPQPVPAPGCRLFLGRETQSVEGGPSGSARSCAGVDGEERSRP